MGRENVKNIQNKQKLFSWGGGGGGGFFSPKGPEKNTVARLHREWVPTSADVEATQELSAVVIAFAVSAIKTG